MRTMVVCHRIRSPAPVGVSLVLQRKDVAFRVLGYRERLGPLPEAGGGLTSARCALIKVLTRQVKKLQDEMSILHSTSANRRAMGSLQKPCREESPNRVLYGRRVS